MTHRRAIVLASCSAIAACFPGGEAKLELEPGFETVIFAIPSSDGWELYARAIGAGFSVPVAVPPDRKMYAALFEETLEQLRLPEGPIPPADSQLTRALPAPDALAIGEDRRWNTTDGHVWPEDLAQFRINEQRCAKLEATRFPLDRSDVSVPFLAPYAGDRALAGVFSFKTNVQEVFEVDLRGVRKLLDLPATLSPPIIHGFGAPDGSVYGVDASGRILHINLGTLQVLSSTVQIGPPGQGAWMNMVDGGPIEGGFEVFATLSYEAQAAVDTCELPGMYKPKALYVARWRSTDQPARWRSLWTGSVGGCLGPGTQTTAIVWLGPGKASAIFSHHETIVDIDGETVREVSLGPKIFPRACFATRTPTFGPLLVFADAPAPEAVVVRREADQWVIWPELHFDQQVRSIAEMQGSLLINFQDGGKVAQYLPEIPDQVRGVAEPRALFEERVCPLQQGRFNSMHVVAPLGDGIAGSGPILGLSDVTLLRSSGALP